MDKKKILIFTGAGVSAESGVATFRTGDDGLWYNHKVEDVATPDIPRCVLAPAPLGTSGSAATAGGGGGNGGDTGSSSWVGGGGTSGTVGEQSYGASLAGGNGGKIGRAHV